MKCILCVKEFGTNTNLHLLIYSAKGQEFDAQHVIEKYFWLKPDELDDDRRLICRHCWKTVLSFHKFYIRIENVHKTLEQVEEESLFIKTEAEVVYCTSLINQTKEEETVDSTTITIKQTEQFNDNITDEPQLKRRGRSRKRSINLEEEVDINNEHNDIEKILESSLIKTHKPIQQQRGRPKKPKTKLNESPAPQRKEKPNAKSKCIDNKQTNNTVDTDANDDNASVSNSKSDESAATIKTKTSSRIGNFMKKMEFDKIIAENFKLICCLCQQTLPNFSELQTHFCVEHNMRGYVLCCGKKYHKRGVLVDHIYTHQNPNYFTCTKCNKVMTNRRSFKLHMNYHETDRIPDYQCGVCKKNLNNRVGYVRHLQLHAPEEAKTIQCPQCPKTFFTKYHMTQHLKLVHLKLYEKICDICGKSIRAGEAFERHQQVHDGITSPQFQCKLCDAALTTRYGLVRHMKKRHTEKYTKSQVCSICSKISPTLMAHQSHMRFAHSMERKHACTLCDKAFKFPMNLKEHMTTHTGEVLYTCRYCPKSFNSISSMYAHRKKAHPKEWEESRHTRSVPCSSTIKLLTKERTPELQQQQ